jgi:dCTP deaminase
MPFFSDQYIDSCIRTGRIRIDPYDHDNWHEASSLQPASYDMHLDSLFKTLLPPPGGVVDPRQPVEYEESDVKEGNAFYLPSLSCALASTIERVELDTNMIGRLEGKSSLGRIFLTAHVTAGFFDPGFRGHATLELFNAGPYPVLLWPGMKICQMSFAALNSHARRAYGHTVHGSKYQDQERGPKGSEMHRNFPG